MIFSREFCFMDAGFSIDNGFDELYFTLGVQTEEEREYVEERFNDFYKEHIGYEIVGTLDEDFFKEDSSKEKLLENLAEPMAATAANGVAECLRLEDSFLDDFYEKDIEERFDYLVFIAENYAVGEAPDLTLQERIDKFGSKSQI